MNQAYIVDCVRTAGGRRGGKLADWHPADMAARMLNALVDRTGIDPAAVDDVILGCVSQIGEHAINVARNAVLASRLPQHIPGVTVDRQCGSSQQAVHFAAQAVMSGTQDIIIAGGVESMTRVPMGTPTSLPAQAGLGAGPWPAETLERYGVAQFSQFDGIELMTEKYGFTRRQLDEYSLTTHQRASQAIKAAAFEREIIPLEVRGPDGDISLHSVDEGVRHDASLEAMATVKLIREGGRLSAANASQICDGASAVMIVSERALKEHGLTPMARIHHMSVTAGDPVIMLEEPIPGTQRALKKAGMKIEDIDLYEVNEAFAPVPMAWLQQTGADPSRLNVNGGAIALGHPLGSSGTKLMTTLVHALKARKLRYGLQTMCEGGGMANVTIVEAL